MHEGAAEKIKELRKEGHYIIIQTARNMATCESNLGKVIRNVGKITLDWLENHHVEYDEIYFGKPNADLYIDDRALRFESWELIKEETLKKMAKDR
jgi:capsule biosynthesis phosphatase